MPKRKKYPKLPNSFGSIRYLGSNRRNPYAVHPPTKEFSLTGSPMRPTALCYVDSWMKGFAVLVAYKSGNYKPGDELSLDIKDTGSLETIAAKILADYSRFRNPETAKRGKTFREVYEEWYSYMYEKDQSVEHNDNTMKSKRFAFKRWAPLHDREFQTITYDDLQKVIDECPLKVGSIEQMVVLVHQLYDYAAIYHLADENCSEHLRITKADEEESAEPFTGDELRILWQHQDDEDVEFLLIMCYSGFRISEYRKMEVNLEQQYFKGGLKNRYSRERTVPIHPAIFPLVKRRLERDGCLITTSQTFRNRLNRRDLFEVIGMNRHTPHGCRHTFSWLCEHYGVRENDRKRMMGHSFGNDTTNKVYGHRSLEELRKEIVKIKTPMEDKDL